MRSPAGESGSRAEDTHGMRERNKARVSWAVAAVLAVLATAGPARAFYWRGWPGSRVANPTLIQPRDQGKPGNPPLPAANPFPPPGGDEESPPPVGPPP